MLKVPEYRPRGWSRARAIGQGANPDPAAKYRSNQIRYTLFQGTFTYPPSVLTRWCWISSLLFEASANRTVRRTVDTYRQ